jgi:hypothetical protein
MSWKLVGQSDGTRARNAAELRKTFRPDVGLALIDLHRSSGL